MPHILCISSCNKHYLDNVSALFRVILPSQGQATPINKVRSHDLSENYVSHFSCDRHHCFIPHNKALPLCINNSNEGVIPLISHTCFTKTPVDIFSHIITSGDVLCSSLHFSTMYQADNLKFHYNDTFSSCYQHPHEEFDLGQYTNFSVALFKLKLSSHCKFLCLSTKVITSLSANFP